MSDQQRQRQWMQRLAQSPGRAAAPPVEEEDDSPGYEQYQMNGTEEEEEAEFDRACMERAAKDAEADAIAAGFTPAAAKTLHDVVISAWYACNVAIAAGADPRAARRAGPHRRRIVPIAYDAAIAAGATPAAATATAIAAGEIAATAAIAGATAALATGADPDAVDAATEAAVTAATRAYTTMPSSTPKP